jgi:putative ABC transport system permease protein
LDAEVGDDIYLSFLAANFVFSRIVAATRGDPGSLVMPITDAVHAVAPDVPLTDVRTFQDVRRNALASPRLTAMLLATFAALALVITATGVAAVIGFSVNQRIHEIGVRMALGARRESVLAMILAQGMRLVIIGLLLGSAGAVLLTRAMSGLLFGVGATDAITFTTVGVLLAGVAVAAAFLPARRATAIDPMVALRSE